MDGSQEYLRSVCLSFAKDHQTLAQISQFVDDPDKIPAFAAACKRIGVNLTIGQQSTPGAKSTCTGKLRKDYSGIGIDSGDEGVCRIAGSEEERRTFLRK
jgi:hypothetical protein